MRSFFNPELEIAESKAFMSQQIMALGSALFFTENDSLLKLPVHVINNVQVDEKQQIWFCIQRPVQELTEFDAELPARLEFFKKGMPYHIKVTGTASLVDNAVKVRELTGSDEMGNLVAVKVTITATEYFETVGKPVQNWLQLGNLFSRQ
ncbi:MAG: hypothetical protein QM731_04090 [Chitinophagaceae bacterium]